MTRLYVLAALVLLVQGATVQETNDRTVKDFMARIAGHETEPAERVFKNVQWLKGVPAGTFLEIMNGGYSKALGVTCAHCHVETDFASDEKRPKRAAREMQVMHKSITINCASSSTSTLMSTSGPLIAPLATVAPSIPERRNTESPETQRSGCEIGSARGVTCA